MARLSISQPAVSKLLQLFERNAGMALFTRDRGRLSPTAEAPAVEEVERVFQSHLRMADAILSGTHETGTSHHELLRAFIDEEQHSASATNSKRTVTEPTSSAIRC